MTDPFIGEIRVFTGDYAPRGWAVCAGQLLSVNVYHSLFRLIGTTYGGDGKQSFALPDLQGRVGIGWGQGKDLSPREIGKTGGVTSVKLSASQMPRHTHLPGASMGTDSEGPEHRIWANPNVIRPLPNFFASVAGTPIALNPGTVGDYGGGESHTNLMSYGALLFCIALEGEPFQAETEEA